MNAQSGFRQRIDRVRAEAVLVVDREHQCNDGAVHDDEVRTRRNAGRVEELTRHRLLERPQNQLPELHAWRMVEFEGAERGLALRHTWVRALERHIAID